jgi:hypothetical protein
MVCGPKAVSTWRSTSEDGIKQTTQFLFSQRLRVSETKMERAIGSVLPTSARYQRSATDQVKLLGEETKHVKGSGSVLMPIGKHAPDEVHDFLRNAKDTVTC